VQKAKNLENRQKLGGTWRDCLVGGKKGFSENRKKKTGGGGGGPPKRLRRYSFHPRGEVKRKKNSKKDTGEKGVHGKSMKRHKNQVNGGRRETRVYIKKRGLHLNEENKEKRVCVYRKREY